MLMDLKNILGMAELFATGPVGQLFKTYTITPLLSMHPNGYDYVVELTACGQDGRCSFGDILDHDCYTVYGPNFMATVVRTILQRLTMDLVTKEVLLQDEHPGYRVQPTSQGI